MMALLRAVWPCLVAGVIALGIYAKGASDERELLTAQHAAELATIRAEHAKSLAAATADVRRIEREHVERMDAFISEHTRAQANEKQKADRIIADLRDGNSRLYVTVNNLRAATGAATAGACSAASDGAARAELSAPLAADVAALGAEADDVVRQLQLCQKIVASDRTVSVRQNPDAAEDAPK